ncbi:MAG: hypothetical protein V1914_01185 [archaeon]
MIKYQLLSGEKIKLKKLRKTERKHISKIESMIKNSEDYIKVYCEYHKLFETWLPEGEYFTPKTQEALYNSPNYKVAYDMILRYEKKMLQQNLKRKHL